MVRAISWPRFESAPRIRVYPHWGFSTAIRTTSAATSRRVIGRPRPRRAGAVVCLGDQSPVPAENRVRRDDAGDLHHDAPSEFLAAHGESTALGIGQAKRPRAQVLPEGIVNLLRAARYCPVKSTLRIVLSRRTSPHPIQRTRGCGADGGEPTARGADRLGRDSARYREPTRTVGAERPT